jgi:phosphatidylglycerol:prolipoprotein diacylglycerol transferase
MLRTVQFVHGGTQVVLSLHGLAIVAGVAAGALLAAARARQPAPVLAGAAAVAVGALAGARALFLLLHGGGGAGASGGLTSMGGVAGGLGAACVVARLSGRRTRELMDAIVPAGLLALAVGRLGCFLAGCCYGRPTALPWGVVFPELGLPPRHPLQLYSAAGDLALVLLAQRSSSAAGAVACRGCIGFGLLRAGLETLRDPSASDVLVSGWLTLAQAVALGLAASAAFALRSLRPVDPSTMPPPRRNAAHGR